MQPVVCACAFIPDAVIGEGNELFEPLATAIVEFERESLRQRVVLP